MEDSGKNEGPDLDRIGLFKEMSYHHEYIPIKISFNDSSKKGRQMLTTCSKTKAGNQDGFFDREFSRAFEGEAYMDRIRLNRLYRLEQAKKNLEPCFKFSSPTKKPSGKGSDYGTFRDYDKKLEHFSSHLKDYVKATPQKKNFLVNPPKKGTGYGYPNLTIGKQLPYFLESEYEELKNTPKEPKKPKPRPFAPFRSGIFHQEYFDPNPFLSDAASFPEESEETEKEERHQREPFKPSNPAKKDGGMKAGCLSPFPEHSSEPYAKISLIPRGVKGYINDQKQMFLPVPGVRPYPVKSIINKNVKKQINSKNFKDIKGVVYCKKASKK